MEQAFNSIGNPTTLLIERVYWLGLGGFLGLTIFTSLIRGLKKNKNKKKFVSAKQLEILAKKATQNNSDKS